jgi:hypothetical protein
MEKYKPVGNPAWKQFTTYYNLHRPKGYPERDDKSLRRRYTSLVETKAPTGDPNVPEEVLEAKRIEEMIKTDCNLVVLGNMEGS